ncbi:MAG: hypothetical protein R2710_05570 [Acidimicrobiales bacterium]
MMSLPKKGSSRWAPTTSIFSELHPQPHQGVSPPTPSPRIEGSREALDELAAESQARAHRAIAEGRFDKSVVPVYNLDGSHRPRSIGSSSPPPAPPVESLASAAGFGRRRPRRWARTITFRQLINQKYPDLDIARSSRRQLVVVSSTVRRRSCGPAPTTQPRLMVSSGPVAIATMANMGDDPPSC